MAIKAVDPQKKNELTPSPGQISERITDYKVYAGAALALFVLLAGGTINKGVQLPQLEVQNKVQPSLQLSQLLLHHQDRYPDGQPALIVAASGGGTRAALYTGAVMEGLVKQDKIKDVIMGSGVSGGGAALAYFAGKRPQLIAEKAEEKEKAWEEFFAAMKHSFIRDVLNSAVEWRTVSSSRLGLLLSESFQDHWKLPEGGRTLGDVKGFGLILNTALAGQFAFPPAVEKHSVAQQALFLCDLTAPDSCGFLTKAECWFRKTSTSDPAGGRLILTNLSLGEGFVKSTGETGGAKGLPIVVRDPITRLEVAAALNANFPPVFSNAAVDIGDKFRYWVTDGGAVDNRGVEMPLFALRDALIDKNGCTAPTERLPKITVVIVDASAYSGKYSQDRGIGSALGAGSQVTSLLAEEQLERIKKVYGNKNQKDDFQVIYMPMPLCLRESGSFGTHWMLQPNIKIGLGESSPMAEVHNVGEKAHRKNRFRSRQHPNYRGRRNDQTTPRHARKRRARGFVS